MKMAPSLVRLYEQMPETTLCYCYGSVYNYRGMFRPILIRLLKG
uniref:Uncharacterized protein n=1 Tax=Brassica oleracea TaxID=3712 RepID=A0A3P6EEY7_BRAOL|nr:unnamed protein product [Brassica oleracea]